MLCKHMGVLFFASWAGLAFAHAAAISTTTIVSVSTISQTSSDSLPIASATWRSVPNTAFGPGENLEFVIKYGMIIAGYSNLTVSSMVIVNDRPAYHIVSAAHSAGVVNTFYKVQDTNDVWLDAQALVTVRYEKRIHEGKYEIEETSLLDQTNHHWKTRSYRIDKNSYEEKVGPLPPNVLDAFGSLYYVRTLPLEEGQSYTVDVHSGDKVYPLTVRVLKKEKVKVPAGKFDCLLVEPFLRGPGIFISKGKKLEVWLTNDERRMPVRMRSEVFIGHVSAELTHYTTTSNP